MEFQKKGLHRKVQRQSMKAFLKQACQKFQKFGDHDIHVCCNFWLATSNTGGVSSALLDLPPGLI